MGVQELLLALCCLCLLGFIFSRRSIAAFIEAINNFHNNFRGGPPSPMHPLPGEDAVLLRRRTPKKRA